MKRLESTTELAGKLYTYQPGNGTKYELLLLTATEGWHILSWVNRSPGGASTHLAGAAAGELHWSYLAEKLNLKSDADTAAILSFVHETTGREVIMPEGYDANGLDAFDRKRAAI